MKCADRAATYWDIGRSDAGQRASAIRLRGISHRLAGAYPEAITAFHEALKIWRGLDPKSRSVGIGLNSLAVALRESNRFDEAEICYREALGIAEALPNPEGTAIYTGNLAALALARKQWQEAERLARKALDLAKSVGHKQLIASNCRRLAESLAHQGRGTEGLHHAERAVAIFSKLHSPDLAEAQATLEECQAKPD